MTQKSVVTVWWSFLLCPVTQGGRAGHPKGEKVPLGEDARSIDNSSQNIKSSIKHRLVCSDSRDLNQALCDVSNMERGLHAAAH